MWAELIWIFGWPTRTTAKLRFAILNVYVSLFSLHSLLGSCKHQHWIYVDIQYTAWMKLTGLVSMVLRATWWDLYSSCLRSTWLWKRGCFLTGSSGPNCGETTLSTGVQDSEKMKGLNIDLAECRQETKRNLHQPAACRRKEELFGGETTSCCAALTQHNQHYNQLIGRDFSFTYIYSPIIRPLTVHQGIESECHVFTATIVAAAVWIISHKAIGLINSHSNVNIM